MSAHTPGPWIYRKVDDKFAPIVQRGAEGGFSVHALTDSRADADARLIAAAPELLEALKLMVDWHAKRDEHNAFLPIESQEPEIQVAMRAIAKATGEAP